jgi:YHS domain-containing protein
MCVKSSSASLSRFGQKPPRAAKEAIMGLDPVCKMEVNPASAEAQSEYEGLTFYFCARECKEKFDRDPERYIDDTDRAEIRARRANPAA